MTPDRDRLLGAFLLVGGVAVIVLLGSGGEKNLIAYIAPISAAIYGSIKAHRAGA